MPGGDTYRHADGRRLFLRRPHRTRRPVLLLTSNGHPIKSLCCPHCGSRSPVRVAADPSGVQHLTAMPRHPAAACRYTGRCPAPSTRPTESRPFGCHTGSASGSGERRGIPLGGRRSRWPCPPRNSQVLQDGPFVGTITGRSNTTVSCPGGRHVEGWNPLIR